MAEQLSCTEKNGKTVRLVSTERLRDYLWQNNQKTEVYKLLVKDSEELVIIMLTELGKKKKKTRKKHHENSNKDLENRKKKKKKTQKNTELKNTVTDIRNTKCKQQTR